MSKKFKNKKQCAFLNSLPTLDVESSDIAIRSKFNFSFFDGTQPAGDDFGDWSGTTGICCLSNLMSKLKEYSRESLVKWKNERSGAGSLKVLECYGAFPKNSDFEHPKSVPHDVIWSRFRLGNKVRLIGFLIPEGLDGKEYKNGMNTFRFDVNTFYVVFLDRNHRFYKTESE